MPLGVLEGLVGYRLRRASALFGSDFARSMEQTGMRQVPFAVLAVVAANPGINQGAVGKLLGIQRANMVALISDLEARGLLSRKTAVRDRRAFLLSLTAPGRAVLEDCHRQILQHEERLLSGLSQQERAALMRLLGKIAERELPIK